MKVQRTLTLVPETGTAQAARAAAAQARSALAAGNDAVDRVFAHWVFMLGKSAARCALGPSRRRVISRALELYDEDTLRAAIEGCAASAWHRGCNDRGREYTDLELVLRDEAHIERFAEEGDRVRQQLQAHLEQRERDAAQAPQPEDAAQAERIQRERQALREIAAKLAGRA